MSHTKQHPVIDAQVTAAARGDREAMAKIVGEHYATVYRFCARRIGHDLAQDAAQDTFITAQKSMKRFDGRSNLRTWLLGIANNHCRNLARKRRMEMTFSDVWASDTPPEEADSQATTAHILVDRETLRIALSKLSAEHREVVLMHEVEGLTYQEAADILGIPVGTVKSRLHHAFLGLRKTVLGCEEVPA